MMLAEIAEKIASSRFETEWLHKARPCFGELVDFS